jgi:PAS domain-containing protein
MKQWELRTVTLPRERRLEPATTRADGRELLDQFPALVWATDDELTFTVALGRELRELGLGPNQIVGTSVSDFLQPLDPDLEVLAAHRRALEGETVECLIHWGADRLHARVGPLRDSIGHVIGTVCVALESAA